MKKLRSCTPYMKYVIVSLFCFVKLPSAHGQIHGACWQYSGAPLKQIQVEKVNIPGADLVKGYIEYLPKDYNSNPTKKYPLLLYFHGNMQFGNGIANDSLGLCNLFGPSLWTGFPTNMVEGWPVTFPDSVTDHLTGKNYSFIFISPQFAYYDYGNAPLTITSLIDYLVLKYRVDPGRIYLAAISAGSNYLLGYLQSSYAAATRVAASAIVSPCTNVTEAGAATIARANLPVWSFQCLNDSACGIWDTASKRYTTTYAQLLVDAINSQRPAPNPRAYATTFPMPNAPCLTLTHDTWGYAYNKDFKQPVNGGASINLYEWMVQYDRSAAITPTPVTFTSFTARLSNKKVYLKWAVAQEENNKEFTIERAGADQRFSVLITIPSRGDGVMDRIYETIDDKPLNDVSFYRLSQTDKDGKKRYFEIRKVINNTSLVNDVVVSPNPFTERFSVYVTLRKPQRINFVITDVSGKKVQSTEGSYAEGGTEIFMKADGLRPGVYFLRIEGESFSDIRKIVKH